MVLSLLEKKTETYLAFRIPGKSSESVLEAITVLHDEYSEHFLQIFKTITVDNGSEFADFAQVEKWGTKVFFATRTHPGSGLRMSTITVCSVALFPREHPLSSIPMSFEWAAWQKLGYRTPEELFELFLYAVYAA